MNRKFLKIIKLKSVKYEKKINDIKYSVSTTFKKIGGFNEYKGLKAMHEEQLINNLYKRLEVAEFKSNRIFEYYAEYIYDPHD